MATSEQDLKELEAAIRLLSGNARKTSKDVSTFGGLIFRTGGQSKTSADQLQKMVTAMKAVVPASGQSFAKTKALAQAELALANMRIQAASSSFALTGNLKKSLNAVEQFGTQQTKVWQASLANMIKPSDAMMKSLTFMAPNFVRAQAGAQNLGAGMLKLNMAALGLGGGLSLVQFLFSVLASAARGTAETYKTLTGAIGINATTVSQSSALYSSARLAGALLGATQEDVIATTKALSAGFVINKKAMQDLGETAGVDVGAAVGEFIGLTKAAGLSSQAANQLAVSLVTAGGRITSLPNQFARLQLAVDQTGLTTDILANSIAGIAPLSVASSQSTERLLNTFAGFSQSFDKSNDVMLRSAREHGQFTRFGRAMQGFAQAVTQISFPEMLAFGRGGAGMAGVNPERALQEALETPRSDILLNLINQTMGQADTKLGKVFVGTALLEKRFGMDALKARDLTAMILGLQEQEAQARGADQKAQVEATKDQIRTSAAMTSLIQNPIERIRDIAESILGAVLDLIAFFRGRGGVLGRVLLGASRSGAAFRPSAESQ